MGLFGALGSFAKAAVKAAAGVVVGAVGVAVRGVGAVLEVGCSVLRKVSAAWREPKSTAARPTRKGIRRVLERAAEGLKQMVRRVERAGQAVDRAGKRITRDADKMLGQARQDVQDGVDSVKWQPSSSPEVAPEQEPVPEVGTRGPEKQAELRNQFLATVRRVTDGLQALLDAKEIDDLEQYLRTLAAVQLVGSLDRTLGASATLDALSEAQAAMLVTVERLCRGEPVEDSEWVNLDRVSEAHMGKPLLVVGSEQMFALWSEEAEQIEYEHEEAGKLEHSLERRKKTLELKHQVEGLNPEDQAELEAMDRQIAGAGEEVERLQAQLRDYSLFCRVGVGLIENLERKEENPVLRERAPAAADLLMRWQNERQTPTAEEREFLESYASAYAARTVRRRERVKRELEVVFST